jgi:hypothetical protein
MAAGDPSQLLNLSNYWVDFYLNGVWKTNSTDDIGLIELDWMGWPGLGSYLIDYFFIQPPTYFNSTGTYNNFLIYHNNFDQGTAEFKTETNAHAYSESFGMKAKTTSRLSKNTWTIKYEMSSVYHEHDATDPANWWIDDETTEVYYELRFNVATGILVFLQYDYSFHDVRETEGSTDIDDEIMNLLIESSSLTTNIPFNWAYSLLGIISLGMIVIIINRKKRR